MDRLSLPSGTGAPIQSDRRMNFVWVVKAGAEKGKSKYTFDPGTEGYHFAWRQEVRRVASC